MHCLELECKIVRRFVLEISRKFMYVFMRSPADEERERERERDSGGTVTIVLASVLVAHND